MLDLPASPLPLDDGFPEAGLPGPPYHHFTRDEWAALRADTPLTLTVDDLRAGVVDERWRELMRFQIRRARKIYAQAERGISALSPDARWPVWAASSPSRPASSRWTRATSRAPVWRR